MSAGGIRSRPGAVSGLVPLPRITFRRTTLSSTKGSGIRGSRSSSAFAASATPTVSLPRITLRRMVTASPPPFRMPVPTGSSATKPPGAGFGKLLASTTLRSMSTFSVEVMGRPGSTTTRIPAVLFVTKLRRTTAFTEFSTSMPMAFSTAMLCSMTTPSSSPT